VISVNGTFAAREARQALENDLNVMLFSDNVSSTTSWR
jgi:succinyl-CoA synthetase alpha subunit